MTVPHMVNLRTAEGAGFTPKGEGSNEYVVDGEDLTLIGTAEMPLTGYHADEILDEKDLPLLYAGYSPCYRKEAGTYGKHTRGLFRVHQFNKLEMYAFCLPEQSKEIHEKFLALKRRFGSKLGFLITWLILRRAIWVRRLRRSTTLNIGRQLIKLTVN